MGIGSSVTIGYEYSLGMHMVFCQGPIDSINVIKFGDREAHTDIINTTSSIYINKPNLFGGRKKEGGIVGKFDIILGDTNAPKNPYLMQAISPDVPAYRGLVSLVLNKVKVCSMSPYPKACSVQVTRIPAKTFNPTKANINNGSANPVNIIYDLITSKENYGMGYDSSAIDIASFTAASDTLYDEGFGLSFALTGQDSVEDVIKMIMNHVNGVFYTSNKTGLFSIKLIRDDYDPNTLQEFNANNVIKFDELQRSSYAEIINQVIVSYKPRNSDKKQTVTVDNLAGVQVQGAVLSQTFDYPAIDNAALASRVAARELRQNSAPIASIKIVVNRDGFELNIGDVFKFSWPEAGIDSIVCRVAHLAFSSFDNNEITISAVEDIFGLPESSYINPQQSEWVDPVTESLPPTFVTIKESSYWDMVRSVDAGVFQQYTDTTAFFRAALPAPNASHINFSLYRDTTGSGDYVKEGEGNYCVTGELSAVMPKNGDNVTVTLNNVKGDLSGVNIGTYCYIDDEMLAVLGKNASLNSVTLGRAVIDTVPAVHGVGALVVFFEKANAKCRTELLANSTYAFKLLTRTSVDELVLADSPIFNATSNFRFDRPYRPGNFKVNADSYPASIGLTDDIALTWTHRNRTQETASLLPYSDNVTNETGVTYNVRILGEGVEIKNETGLTSPSYTLTTADELAATTLVDGGSSPRLANSYTVELDAVRGSVVNYQKTTHTFTRA